MLNVYLIWGPATLRRAGVRQECQYPDDCLARSVMPPGHWFNKNASAAIWSGPSSGDPMNPNEAAEFFERQALDVG